MTAGKAFTALGSALYAAIDAATALPVYQGIAPQGGTPPYALFNRQTARDDYTFTSRGVSATYQVKVVSNRQFPGEAQTAYDTLHGGLQDAALSVTGYTVQRVRRETTIEYMDGDRFWHVGGIYRIDIQEA